ncbi:nucleotide exchange factor GrpE [bacterium]|nr:nucleotide exchange factor GrpE [bacterium]
MDRKNLTQPAEGRGRYRWRRLFYNPRRRHISVKERFLERGLESSLLRLIETPESVDAEKIRLKEQIVRARAEFDNFRRRTRREKEDLKKQAIGEVVEALIPALDSFDHALAALDRDHDATALAEGILAIHQQMEKAFSTYGVEKINPVGEPFDPNFHEGLGVVQTEEHPANTVIDVLQSGWAVDGRLVRPARVKIAQKPVAS